MCFATTAARSYAYPRLALASANLALAEFEGDLIRERTMAGLAAARARGRHGGRKLWIPTQGGQAFRSDRGHPTDLMAATIPI